MSEKDLMKALVLIRDFRAKALLGNWDPWAVRQALIIAFEIGTVAALKRGISRNALEEFDLIARSDARQWAKRQGS